MVLFEYSINPKTDQINYRLIFNEIKKQIIQPNSRFYFDYSDNLVDEYDDTYHRCIDKKPADADYSALAAGIETNLKATICKVGDRVKIINYNNIFSKDFTKHW